MMQDDRHAHFMQAQQNPVPLFNVIRQADTTPLRWRNGGGMTREIAVSPAMASFDNFDWRISIADIEQPGAFSQFPGIDRSLTVIDGEAMVLIQMAPASVSSVESDTAVMAPSERYYPLARWESLCFAGETRIKSHLPAGPTRDFNLMWRRDSMAGQVDVLRAVNELQLAPGSTVLYIAAGSYRVATTQLDAGDALIMHNIEATTLPIEPMDAEAVLIRAHIVSMTHSATESTATRATPALAE